MFSNFSHKFKMASNKTQNRLIKAMTKLSNRFVLFCDKLPFLVKKSDWTIKQTVNYLYFILVQM